MCFQIFMPLKANFDTREILSYSFPLSPEISRKGPQNNGPRMTFCKSDKDKYHMISLTCGI